MSVLAATHPTLLDVMKMMGEDGQLLAVADISSQINEVLDDAVYLEANGITGHRCAMFSGLPSATWKKLYGGVQPTRARVVQVTDSMGNLQQYAEVDADLADMSGNVEKFRAAQEFAHINGLNAEMAQTLFYGNEGTEPAEFTGLSLRFASTSAENGSNVLAHTADATQCTSIWLVVWGPMSCHMLYPKGSRAGLARDDKGRVTAEDVDGAGGRSEMYRTHLKWMTGISVPDWRYVVRIQTNQDNMTRTGSGAATSDPNLIDLMSQALDLVPSLSVGRAAFYANRTVKGFVRRQMVNATANATLTTENVAGNVREVLRVGGVPVRRCDALTNSETQVT